MNEQPIARQEGDRIRFRVMPWVWPNGTIYEGVITEIVIPANNDIYYHVRTTIGSEQVKEGMVFEREVVTEEEMNNE